MEKYKRNNDHDENLSSDIERINENLFGSADVNPVNLNEKHN